MKKYRLFILALGLLAFLLAACGGSVNIRDNNFLNDLSLVTGDPCTTPCWNNIVPGETSWRDAQVILEDDARVTNTNLQESEDSDAAGVSWQTAEGAGCCQMVTLNGETVDYISLILSPRTLVFEVLEVYGDPQFVVSEVIDAEQALLSLVYSDIPLVITAFVEGETGALNPSSEVIGVAYMTDEAMNTSLESTSMYAWDGYKDFAAYNDGEFDYVPEASADAENDG